MLERVTRVGFRPYVTLILAIVSFGAAELVARGTGGGWWMLPLSVGLLSTITLIGQVTHARRQSHARQQIVQAYIDRLLLAKTPEDRQPILSEMARRRVLKDIRLYSSDLEYLDLSFADFSGADLSGATLSGANLTGVNLTGATLSYANLSYATLHGAILTGAHLRGANFHGADLRQTVFTNTFMRGAALGDAALNDAMLTGAQLHGADLRDADLRGAKLDGATLTRAKLPDGQLWDEGTDLKRFTDPQHPAFWQANGLYFEQASSLYNPRTWRREERNED